MKRIVCWIIAVLCAMPCALGEGSIQDWYFEVGAQMTKELGVLVSDEAYVEMYMAADLDCVDVLREADYEQVLEAYYYKMPSMLLMKLIMNLAEDEKMSDIAWELFEMRFPQMILSLYGGSKGSEALAATTMMTFSRTFSEPEDFSAGLLLLVVPDGMAGVAFTKTGDDTVTATIQPVFLMESGAEETIEAIESSSLIPMKAEKIR